jgi:N-carbamoylputrescine amidase
MGLVQMELGPDPEQNLARALQNVYSAAQADAQVVCLPELFRSRYFCQQEEPDHFDLAEPIPGPTTEALSRAAREAGVVVIAPIFERQTAGIYFNSLAVIDRDGALLGKYRKMHIPDDPGYYEKYYFSPGDLGFRQFDTAFGRIGALICWDQWFPEAARLTAMGGAVVLVYPTAIGWHPAEKEALGQRQRDAWQTVQRGHAIANGIYVAAINRVGHEIPASGGDGIEFWGSSFVADPQGVLVAEASSDAEEIVLATIDPARLEDVRRNWPFWRDRRVDAYAALTRRYLDNA